jgi:hypothetical protein
MIGPHLDATTARGMAWARRQAVEHLRNIAADLRRDDNERHGAALVVDELLAAGVALPATLSDFQILQVWHSPGPWSNDEMDPIAFARAILAAAGVKAWCTFCGKSDHAEAACPTVTSGVTGTPAADVAQLRTTALWLVNRMSDERLGSTERYSAEKELNRVIHRLAEAAAGVGAADSKTF